MNEKIKRFDWKNKKLWKIVGIVFGIIIVWSIGYSSAAAVTLTPVE